MREVRSVQGDAGAIRVEEIVCVSKKKQLVQVCFCGVEFGALNRDL
jgi:hypothetical protein